MGHLPTSEAISGGTWELVAEFTSDPPKQVTVRNASTSANAAEFLVVPMHIAEAPTDEDGWSLAAGEEKSFFDAVARGGDGRITAVYAKSSGATVEVVVDVR